MSDAPFDKPKSKFLLEMEAAVSPAVLAAPADRAELYNMVGGIIEEFQLLKARVTKIEKGGVKYAGVYQKAVSYPRGSMVTFDGSLFAAWRDIREGEAPAQPDTGWQLAVKKGRDGK